jgi:hypothetical protein
MDHAPTDDEPCLFLNLFHGPSTCSRWTTDYTRLNRAIQLTSQDSPSSSENACSR